MEKKSDTPGDYYRPVKPLCLWRFENNARKGLNCKRSQSIAKLNTGKLRDKCKKIANNIRLWGRGSERQIGPDGMLKGGGEGEKNPCSQQDREPKKFGI